MGVEWYYATGGTRHGPVSATELKQLATSGQLAPDDPVWKGESSTPVAARSVKGLFAPATPAAIRPAATALPEWVRDQQGGPVSLPRATPAPTAGPGRVPAAGRVPPAVEPLPLDDEPPIGPRPGPAPVARRWVGTPALLGAAAGGLLLAVLAGVGVLYLAFGRGGGSGGGGGAAGEPVVEARQLAQTFLADRAAADAQYRGKAVTVRGVVDKPAAEYSRNEISVETTTEAFKLPVVFLNCRFGAKYEDQLGRLRRGDEVRFRGVCRGLSPHSDPSSFLVVEFEDCELLSGGGSAVRPVPSGRAGDHTGSAAGGRVTRDRATSTLRRGMTEGEVADALGQPESRTAPLTVAGVRRQEWMFGGPDNVMVFFADGRLESASSLQGPIIRR